MFFDRVPRISKELKESVWNSLERQAWMYKSIEELTFLIFCKAFYFISGEKTNSESEYWNLIIKAEIELRKFLINKCITVTQQEMKRHNLRMEFLFQDVGMPVIN